MPPLDVGEPYRRYWDLVLRRPRRFFDQSEAEWVAHEVFTRVMDKHDTFRAEASPANWLYPVTTNRCLNKLRNAGRRCDLLEQQTPFLSRQSGSNLEGQTYARDLWKRIDPELVQIGGYHHVDGMTNPEIARIIGCSPRTVVNQLQSLREAVRKLTEPA